MLDSPICDSEFTPDQTGSNGSTCDNAGVSAGWDRRVLARVCIDPAWRVESMTQCAIRGREPEVGL